MQRFFFSLLIPLALLVGCDVGEGPHVSSRALVSPADNSTLNVYSPIKINFNSNMDTSTLLLNGSLVSESDSGVWSATRYVNDTFTIRPATEWSSGNHTLTVDVKNFYDMPIATLDLTYTVDPSLNAGALVINEIDYRDSGADNLEFVEILNVGVAPQSLSGVNLILFDGTTFPATVYNTIDLSGGNPVANLASGEYLVVAGDDGSLNAGGAIVIDLATSDLILNANAGVALHDTNTNELLDALSYGSSISSVQIGATIFSLVEGVPSDFDDEEDYSFRLTSANPTGFVDISATGADLAIPDDGEVNFASTVTNDLGDWTTTRVGDNGAIYNAAIGDIPPDNGPLPNAIFPSSTAVLMPFWDDMDCVSAPASAPFSAVFADELSVNSINTLVVQWNNCPRYSDAGGIGAATFQTQIFSSGAILARYAYKDVDFGNATYDSGASATIGVQTDTASPPGSFGQFSYNSATVYADDTIDILSGKSLSRSPNGIDTNNAAVDFVISGATPGSANL